MPEPLTAEELKNFDQDYARDEKQSGGAGYAYGQINPETKKPVDTDYRYYISLYGYFDRKMVPKKTRDTTSQGRGRRGQGKV